MWSYKALNYCLNFCLFTSRYFCFISLYATAVVKSYPAGYFKYCKDPSFSSQSKQFHIVDFLILLSMTSADFDCSCVSFYCHLLAFGQAKTTLTTLPAGREKVCRFCPCPSRGILFLYIKNIKYHCMILLFTKASYNASGRWKKKTCGKCNRHGHSW